MSQKQRPSKAFTLFEMLIVVSILLILIAMLLPAIQQIRESARRIVCQNNELQLAVAVKQYESAHEHLPPGVINDSGPVTNDELGRDISFLVTIMPFLEQAGISESFDFAGGAYVPENEEIRAIVLPFLHCMSDFAFNAASNYAGCHHHQEAPIDTDNLGLLFLNSSIRHRDIKDGRSNTILLGEKVVDVSDLTWISGTKATLRNTGSYYPDSFKSAVDPAKVRPADALQVAEELIVGGFGSRHSGGSNFAFADGSLHFISYLIDPVVYEHLGHRADGAMMGQWQ
jgi:prepilin-type processing-associated H-X9-DG protein/prepilin-type N-terminal cleavage/methylation domain-containing protein